MSGSITTCYLLLYTYLYSVLNKIKKNWGMKAVSCVRLSSGVLCVAGIRWWEGSSGWTRWWKALPTSPPSRRWTSTSATSACTEVSRYPPLYNRLKRSVNEIIGLFIFLLLICHCSIVHNCVSQPHLDVKIYCACLQNVRSGWLGLRLV